MAPSHRKTLYRAILSDVSNQEVIRAYIIKNLLAKQSLTKRSREIHSTEEDQAIIATVTPRGFLNLKKRL